MKLRFADYMQRGVTLTLFSITMYGALVVGDGAFDIISRRIAAGPAKPPAAVVPSDTEKK